MVIPRAVADVNTAIWFVNAAPIRMVDDGTQESATPKSHQVGAVSGMVSRFA